MGKADRVMFWWPHSRGLFDSIFSTTRQTTRPLLTADRTVSPEARFHMLFNIPVLEAPNRVELPTISARESVTRQIEAKPIFIAQNGVRLGKHVIICQRLEIFKRCFGTLHRRGTSQRGSIRRDRHDRASSLLIISNRSSRARTRISRSLTRSLSWRLIPGSS